MTENMSNKINNNEEINTLLKRISIEKLDDGTEKFLNDKKWQTLGLLKSTDLVDQLLSMDECCLYFKDWSKNPTFGKMDGNYPPSTLPDEILNLLN